VRHNFSWKLIDSIARAGSIRQAAEALSITSTALNRRLLSLEEELGVLIFERLPRGVRPTAAGELLIHHARTQLSDMERVISQIDDLSGERRGHVAIACSQALLPHFMPEQIALYRAEHPRVTFSVLLRDRGDIEQALIDYTADIALVFEPSSPTFFQTLVMVSQPICVVMDANHPLTAKKTVRLRDCLDYPIGLPLASYGVRHLIEIAQLGCSFKLNPVIESDSFEFLRNYPTTEHLLTFQIPIGLPAPGAMKSDALCYLPINVRDVPEGLLCLGKLRGRALPIAAAKFAEQVGRALSERFAKAER